MELRFDGLTDIVEQVKDATSVEPQTPVVGNREVVDSQGETVILGDGNQSRIFSDEEVRTPEF